jgi:hypothetical protein
LTPLLEELVDYLVAGVIVVVFGFGYWIIIDALENQVETVPYEPRYQRPDIPDCDKELWLRVKDGCP